MFGDYWRDTVGARLFLSAWVEGTASAHVIARSNSGDSLSSINRKATVASCNKMKSWRTAFHQLDNTQRRYEPFISKHLSSYFASLSLILAAVLCPLSVYGASFDCAKAKTTVEKMICADDELSRLDSELAAIYKKALTTTKNTEEIKSKQKQWLSERNTCSDAFCVKAAYKKRIKELVPSGQPADEQQIPENSKDVDELNTQVRIEDLGENWHYKRDADKVPVIRQAMKTVELNPQFTMDNPAPFCRTFKKDFIAGKFQVIEPEIQILYLNDPRLDKRWRRCDGIDPEKSTATSDDNIFNEFPWIGRNKTLPPYRYYQVAMDTNLKNEGHIADVIEVRFDEGLAGRGAWKTDGYSQAYLWVDLDGCEIRGEAQVISQKVSNPDWPDALSMLIRYQGRIMVLSYKSYPSYRAFANSKKEKMGELNYLLISLELLTHKKEFCTWTSPIPSDSDKPLDR